MISVEVSLMVDFGNKRSIFHLVLMLRLYLKSKNVLEHISRLKLYVFAVDMSEMLFKVA